MKKFSNLRPFHGIIAMLFCMIALQSHAQAQDSLDNCREFRRARTANIVYHSLEASYIALQAADYISTMYSLENLPIVEDNSLMVEITKDPILAALVKTAAIAGTLYGLKIIRKERPGLAMAELIAMNLFYAGVVTHNVTIILRFKP